MSDMSKMVAVAEKQHGLVSTQQLLELGMSRGRRQTLVRSGLLIPHGRGVARLAGSRPSWEQDLLAVMLGTRRTLVASHRAALRLWDLRKGFDDLEVTVRHPGNCQIPGVVVHRSVDLEPSDIVCRNGLPVTSLPRTLCDAGLIFPQHEVQRLVDHAVARNLVNGAELMFVRRRVSEHGRNGVVKLEMAVAGLPPDREDVESGPEGRLLRLILDAGLERPELQYPVEVRGRSYRIDLAYPRLKLGLEYDGYDFHSGPEAFSADRRRQNDLVDSGWTIRRYTHVDLRDRPGVVVAGIRRHLTSSDNPDSS